jgi:peptidoglycan/xylan/chitin deacetylase (PgdA/CDA1 family)
LVACAFVSYKPALRDGLARALSACRATAPERFARGALTVVTFHRVLPEDQLRHYPMPGLAVTPEQLEAILSLLAVHFECTTLIEGFRRWSARGGRVEPTDRPLLSITFDDGALDNFVQARPVLDRLGLRASFYVPVGNVDEQRAPWHDRLGFALLRSVAARYRRPRLDLSPLLAPFGVAAAELSAVLPREAIAISQRAVVSSKSLSSADRQGALTRLEEALEENPVPDWAGMMSWEQIRALAAEGHEVGSHSMTHPLLPDCDRERLHDEIAGSLARLRVALGSEVSSFCYPNGSYDARCLAEVRDAGYECAVTTGWGLNRARAPRPFELLRCDMDYSRLTSRRGVLSPERLMLRLSGLQPGLSVRR